MKTSQVASQIYQAAKKAAAGKNWNWKQEWQNAMKAAWKQVVADVKIKSNRKAEEPAKLDFVKYPTFGCDSSTPKCILINNYDPAEARRRAERNSGRYPY